MKSKLNLVAYGIIAGLLVGTLTSNPISVMSAFAEKPADPDCWGEESAQQGKTGDAGKHASDPIPGDDDRETPRSGIGNLAPHPSDLGEALNGADDCEED
jgi:hypothetical protein